MNNIINLVKKEFLAINILHPRYLLIIIMAIAYSLFIPKFVPISYYMLTLIIVINSFYMDEASRGNYLTYSLPVSKKEYIISKYIFSLVSILIIVLIISIGSFIGNTLCTSLGLSIGEPSLLSFKTTFLFGISLCLCMVGIIIPAIIKFTYKNLSAIFTIIMLAMAFSASSLMTNLPKDISININNLAIIASLASILLFFASFFISKTIMKKKEILN
ncbi:ABC-2 transporter permease [Clostridium massiliamazoniense]|uniref:ABC-2 transporter permease n=1 Tax=Clostridium massiliamazoniense TaxID=1347366 RepID=UPI0006D7F34F|nr:ABC-2 transporter permease [Clostridium massiliamazoniense]